jgi:hypothetical protein
VRSTQQGNLSLFYFSWLYPNSAVLQPSTAAKCDRHDRELWICSISVSCTQVQLFCNLPQLPSAIDATGKSELFCFSCIYPNSAVLQPSTAVKYELSLFYISVGCTQIQRFCNLPQLPKAIATTRNSGHRAPGERWMRRKFRPKGAFALELVNMATQSDLVFFSSSISWYFLLLLGFQLVVFRPWIPLNELDCFIYKMSLLWIKMFPSSCKISSPRKEKEKFNTSKSGKIYTCIYQRWSTRKGNQVYSI